MSSRGWAALLALSMGSYVLLPGHPLALSRGLPLDWLGVSLLAALGCLLFAFGLPTGGLARVESVNRLLRTIAAAALVLLALKLLLWVSAPEYGLAASYYPRARLSGAPERSTQHPTAAYTRLERSPGAEGFQLHFFNDVERFNYYEAPDPDRLSLPFAVRYDGYLHVPAGGPRGDDQSPRGVPFELSARGVAILSVDGSPALTVGGRDAIATDQAALTLAPGPHPIRLDFLHQGGNAPSLRLAADLGQGIHPLAAPSLTVQPIRPDVLTRDRAAGSIAVILDALTIVGLAAATLVTVVRRVRLVRYESHAWPVLVERPLLALVMLVATVYALVTTAPLAGRATILEGGQDWLTYESYARDILLNGPLMTLGEPLGKGKPFFFQPFYPYYLAGLHWLTGEGLWGPIVLQLAGLGVAAVVIYALGKRLFGAVAGVAALGLFLVLGLTQLDWIARKLLSENLYFVVLPAALLMLARAVDERSLRDLAWAGLLFGVAAITRAPTLLFMPGAALILVLAWRRSGVPLRRVAAGFMVLALCTTVVAALVPIRNLIVSGKPALVASNGGATLLLAHQPTEKVRLSGIDRDPLYNRLGLDRATREVVEFARQDPVGYIWTLVPLGLYSVGVSGAVEDNRAVAPDVLGITALYVLAVVCLPAARTLRTWPLHLFIVIHFGIMMTFLPYVYGYRQVLPMQVLMLAFDGALIAQVVRFVGERRRRQATHQPVMEQRPA
ncbi:MAG: glycosyltransferase family 39 protein [Chloroflexi bacterium]|nr:glycosyltransferase family 39 protein [Chloroflexota bacterium]